MTEKEHGSVAMGDSREEDGMPERIWAGDFDGQGFGHCVAGMQGGLYEEYVRADLARPVQEPVAWLSEKYEGSRLDDTHITFVRSVMETYKSRGYEITPLYTAPLSEVLADG